MAISGRHRQLCAGSRIFGQGRNSRSCVAALFFLLPGLCRKRFFGLGRLLFRGGLPDLFGQRGKLRQQRFFFLCGLLERQHLPLLPAHGQEGDRRFCQPCAAACRSGVIARACGQITPAACKAAGDAADGNERDIADVQRLYQVNRGLDFDKKAALKDLIEGGYIQSNDALAKIKFTTELQDDALIAKYSDARIGRNLRARINDLIDEAKIGQIADEDFQQMSISKGMQIIAANAELERSRHPMATPGQIALLQKMEQRGQIDLHKIDLTRLRFRTADQWIKQNINNPARNTHNPDAPATTKQRGLLTLLVREKLIKNIPYSEWRDMTVDQASKRISSVPPRLLQQAIERQNAPQRNISPRQRTSMER